ncbi:MAG: cytidylate kinase family protein [Desulfobacteraceae bacterium]|jgi:cytidylate kinase
MPIITISRGSYSKGKEVAEKVAQKLGYECVSREILLEASEEFHTPEIRLIRAIHNSPSILNSFTFGKIKYIAYVQAALLKHFQKDNIVYHGLAGHFFIKGISHVLKVRIIANMEDRVRLEMEREGITEQEALHILEKDDEERRRWSRHLYGIDTRDSSLYDIVLHIHKITVYDAVDIICQIVGLEQFQATPESRQAMDDLVLSAKVKAALLDTGHDMHVSAQSGMVFVETESTIIQLSALIQEIEKITKAIDGVKDVKPDVQIIT